MSESVVLPISGSMERVSTRTTNDDRKPRPEKCACAITRGVAVLRPSMYAYNDESKNRFDSSTATNQSDVSARRGVLA